MTHESGGSVVPKAALQGEDAGLTILTRVFTGRYARGLVNRSSGMSEYEDIPSYPLQHDPDEASYISCPWADQALLEVGKRLRLQHSSCSVGFRCSAAATVAEAVRTHHRPRIIIRFQRFSSTSIGLAGGESLLEVSRRLAHCVITITADTYSHVSAATAAESAKRLAQLIDDAS